MHYLYYKLNSLTDSKYFGIHSITVNITKAEKTNSKKNTNMVSFKCFYLSSVF